MPGSLSRSGEATLVFGGHAVLERGGGGDELEHRARAGRSRGRRGWTGAAGCPSPAGCTPCSPHRCRDWRPRSGRSVGLVTIASTAPVVGSSATTAPLRSSERLGRGSLHPGLDGRLDGGALRCPIGDEVDQSADEQGVVGAGELAVVRALQTGPAVVVGVEAGHRGVEPVLRVDPLELEAVLRRLGDRHRLLSRRQDRARGPVRTRSPGCGGSSRWRPATPAGTTPRTSRWRTAARTSAWRQRQRAGWAGSACSGPAGAFPMYTWETATPHDG